MLACPSRTSVTKHNHKLCVCLMATYVNLFDLVPHSSTSQLHPPICEYGYD